MFRQLVEALHHALSFREIPPDSISRMDSKVGFIWFKAGDQTYWIDIRKAEFDLDEYADECPKNHNEHNKF